MYLAPLGSELANLSMCARQPGQLRESPFCRSCQRQKLTLFLALPFSTVRSYLSFVWLLCSICFIEFIIKLFKWQGQAHGVLGFWGFGVLGFRV